MDDFDKRIVELLQSNGRITNIDLATHVGLTHSACARRIQRLEKDGVIRGYRALVNRSATGQHVRSFVGLMCKPNSDFRQVGARLAKLPHVIGCYIMSGDFDIMVEVIADDMDCFSSVVQDELLKTQGVQSTRSALVLEEIASIY